MQCQSTMGCSGLFRPARPQRQTQTVDGHSLVDRPVRVVIAVRTPERCWLGPEVVVPATVVQ